MNEQQIEAACRLYCELRGLDPDAERGYALSDDPRWFIGRQWQAFREKVIDHYCLTCAVQSQQLSQDPGIK